MSWILLDWADHRKSILRNSITSALLGLIATTPISGIAGSHAGSDFRDKYRL